MSLTVQEKREILKELLQEVREELTKPVNIPVEICRDSVELPEYARLGDSGMDIRSAIDATIMPGQTLVIPTGLQMAIPQGYEIQVRPRSGVSLKTPLRVANAPGTIDSGFRDEIGIIVSNNSSTEDLDKEEMPIYGVGEKGSKPGIYEIHKGDRIAQIVLAKVETINFELVEPGKVKTIGVNRGGGFGHSGVK